MARLRAAAPGDGRAVRVVRAPLARDPDKSGGSPREPQVYSRPSARANVRSSDAGHLAGPGDLVARRGRNGVDPLRIEDPAYRHRAPHLYRRSLEPPRRSAAELHRLRGKAECNRLSFVQRRRAGDFGLEHHHEQRRFCAQVLRRPETVNRAQLATSASVPPAAASRRASSPASPAKSTNGSFVAGGRPPWTNVRVNRLPLSSCSRALFEAPLGQTGYLRYADENIGRDERGETG